MASTSHSSELRVEPTVRFLPKLYLLFMLLKHAATYEAATCLYAVICYNINVIFLRVHPLNTFPTIVSFRASGIGLYLSYRK